MGEMSRIVHVDRPVGGVGVGACRASGEVTKTRVGEPVFVSILSGDLTEIWRVSERIIYGRD
jgi:ABC-type sugar transport system ATPase subunit